MLGGWISFAVIAAVVSSLVSLFVSEVFFGIFLLLWMVDCWRRREFCLRTPPFFGLILAFFLATLVAVVFSSDVLVSAGYLKKFVKFLYIFFIFTYLSRKQVEYALRAIFLVLAVSAMYGVLQYFWLKEVNLVNRIEGFMGHWMTFSGQLMIGSVALAGYLLFCQLPRASGRNQKTREQAGNEKTENRLLNRQILEIGAWAGLLAVFLFVLVLTHTRNAWLGTIGGLFLLLSIYRVRWLMAGSVLLLALFFALPGDFKERLYSSFDPNDTTTRIRIELLRTGKNIITAHPWTGLGPRMVPRLYGNYNGTDEFPSWIYQHLHNNLVHIAAEMGMITLLVWLALWIRLLRDFARFARLPNSDSFSRCVAISAIGVLAAFLLAGLFEYNFGDSEILILLLFFITIPYVVHHEQEKAA